MPAKNLRIAHGCLRTNIEHGVLSIGPPNAMKLPFLGLFAALLLTPGSVALAQQDLPAITVHGHADYTGVWRPDHEANVRLEREMRKKMRKKMKQERGKSNRAPAFPSGNAGPPPEGNGGTPDARSGSSDGKGFPAGAAEPTLHGSMRQEMDFASPLQGDLEILSGQTEILIGRAGSELTRLAIGRGAAELPDGHTRAFAAWDQQQLVIEINTDDGVAVAHTYSLEQNGERLRVRTNVTGRMTRVPGGIDLERVYLRQP